MTDKIDLSPGEKRTKQRKRRQLYYYGVALILGGVIGMILAWAEDGEGSFMSSDFANLSLDPTIALIMAAALIVAFLILPLWGFTMIDEHLKNQNLVGFTGGCMAVLSGYPVWVLLFAGGFAPYPHAFGVFCLAFFGMLVSFLYAKIRL